MSIVIFKDVIMKKSFLLFFLFQTNLFAQVIVTAEYGYLHGWRTSEGIEETELIKSKFKKKEHSINFKFHSYNKKQKIYTYPTEKIYTEITLEDFQYKTFAFPVMSVGVHKDYSLDINTFSAWNVIGMYWYFVSFGSDNHNVSLFLGLQAGPNVTFLYGGIEDTSELKLSMVTTLGIMYNYKHFVIKSNIKNRAVPFYKNIDGSYEFICSVGIGIKN